MDREEENPSSVSDNSADFPEGATDLHPTRNSARKARERVTKWANILSRAPEDVTDS